MEIPPLDSGLWSGEWRLDLDRATLMWLISLLSWVTSVKKYSGAQAWKCAAQTLYFSAHTEKNRGNIAVYLCRKMKMTMTTAAVNTNNETPAMMAAMIPAANGNWFVKHENQKAVKMIYLVFYCPIMRGLNSAQGNKVPYIYVYKLFVTWVPIDIIDLKASELLFLPAVVKIQRDKNTKIKQQVGMARSGS